MKHVQGMIGFMTALLLCAQPVSADVERDGSVGPDSGVQPNGPDYLIPETMGEFAPGSDANLFHSFSDFSLTSLQSATFTGPDTVANILARVTGQIPSNIDGLLSSQISGADLYLINPWGVIFGENARLDVNGSFFTTTADGIRLGESGNFPARDTASTVLTVDAPSAFYFLGNGPVAPITVTESLLEVPTGKSISLIGGDINVEGADHPESTTGGSSTLLASGGQIALISVASAGEVGTDASLTGFTSLGDIRLAAPAAEGPLKEGSNLIANVTGDPAGTVVIRGGQLVMEQGGLISAGVSGDTDHPGVSVDIDITGDFTMRGYSEIGASTFGLGDSGDVLIRVGGEFAMFGNPDSPAFGGFGNNSNIGARSFGTTDADGNPVGGDAGVVDISANSILMGDLTFIQSATFSNGQGGLVRLTASDRIDILSGKSRAFISSGVFNGGSGDAGAIEINTGDLLVRGGLGDAFAGIAVQVNSSAAGNPDGGNIVINASGTVEVSQGAQISSSIFHGAGSGGDIVVNADALIVSGLNLDAEGEVITDPDFFASGLFSRAGAFQFFETPAKSGDISIATNSLVVEDGAQILAEAQFPSAADAGNITIDTASLTMANSGSIANNSFGFGNGALLSIRADDIVIQGPSLAPTFTGTGISAQAGTAAASASRVQIDTTNLTILDGGSIASSTSGMAPGGPININAEIIRLAGFDDIPAEDFPSGLSDAPSRIVSNSEIFQNFVDFSGGDGGEINITSDILEISDRAELAARSITTGSGGDVNVSASQILVSDAGSISVSSSETGDAGNITVMAPVLNMEAGRISAQAALADGGNIVLEGDRFVLQDADVTAAVGGGLGDGGNVNILAFDYMVLNRSSIAASAIGGQGGNILITTNALIGDNQSTLDASSELGIDGTVVVNSPENEVERALLVPSGDYTDAEALLQARCSAATTAQSSLVVTSGDGLPPSPDAFLSFAGSTDTFTTASIKNPPFLAQLTCVP